MKTVYDQNPEAWDEIASKGRPNVAEMAKRFATHQHMDAALGFQRASKNWVDRRGQVSNAAEASARNWLAAHPMPKQEEQIAASASDGVLMVIPPASKIDAVRRVLVALGCEVIDI